MSNIAPKTSANVFYRARCEAAKHNEALSSREGAADIMAIDRGRLYRIESGIANPYPDEVRLMTDLYLAPELENRYCTHMCPLGSCVPEAFAGDFDRITLRTLAALSKAEEARGLLLEIAADGTVDDDQVTDMQKVMTALEEIERVTQSLGIWLKKNLGKEGT
ncbi:MAG: hypothetical protein LUD72_11575 [Bacteroidales bacterium]|nr:hypothetical protein [Bacteroidales bacterium]